VLAPAHISQWSRPKSVANRRRHGIGHRTQAIEAIATGSSRGRFSKPLNPKIIYGTHEQFFGTLEQAGPIPHYLLTLRKLDSPHGHWVAQDILLDNRTRGLDGRSTVATRLDNNLRQEMHSLLAEARGWGQVHSLVPSLLNSWHVLTAAEHRLLSIIIMFTVRWTMSTKAQDGPWDNPRRTVTFTRRIDAKRAGTSSSRWTNTYERRIYRRWDYRLYTSRAKSSANVHLAWSPLTDGMDEAI
jgi:hypothetical protein